MTLLAQLKKVFQAGNGEQCQLASLLQMYSKKSIAVFIVVTRYTPFVWIFFFPIQLYLAYCPSLSLNLSRLCFFFIETGDSILSSSVLLQSSPSVNGHVFIFIFFSSDLIASSYFCSIYRRNYKLRLCYTDVY